MALGWIWYLFGFAPGGWKPPLTSGRMPDATSRGQCPARATLGLRFDDCRFLFSLQVMRRNACPPRSVVLVFFLALWAGTGRFLCAAPDENRPPATVDYFEPADLTGTVYTKAVEPKEVLFTFRRSATRSGSTVRVLRDYARPDGTVAARERVVYEAGKLVSFQLEEPQNGAHGSARVQSEPKNPNVRRIAFEYTQNHKTKTGNEPLGPDTLVNDMIGPFIAAHWNALTNRPAVRFRYAAVTRAETVGFKFTKESETIWRGKPAAVIRMEPTSWIIARLVDPLRFTVEQEGRHRILQYVGRTSPRIRKGNSWEDLDALTVFDWK